jgi:hypothetical protein
LLLAGVLVARTSSAVEFEVAVGSASLAPNTASDFEPVSATALSGAVGWRVAEALRVFVEGHVANYTVSFGDTTTGAKNLMSAPVSQSGIALLVVPRIWKLDLRLGYGMASQEFGTVTLSPQFQSMLLSGLPAGTTANIALYEADGSQSIIGVDFLLLDWLAVGYEVRSFSLNGNLTMNLADPSGTNFGGVSSYKSEYTASALRVAAKF